MYLSFVFLEFFAITMEAGDELRYLNEQFKPALADFLDAKWDLDWLPLQLFYCVAKYRS